MIFKRDLTGTLKRFAKFPVVALLGPRQSGKTTLAKNTFPNHIYLNFENLETRDFAKTDPKRFLSDNENEFGIIIDEFQHVPEILSYIQVEADSKDRPGYFVLTGSQNYLMNEKISQSLAGRVGILTLLPLSIHELVENNLHQDINQTLFNGGYPRLYDKDFSPTEIYPSYIHTYIERDVRQLTNVADISVFQKCMALCAGRIGQQLNIADIATNCGVEQKVISQWLSILESSYIIFLLKPYHKNFKKRITKNPKLYFYDTGVACSLLNIRSASDISLSPFRGPLFENFIISDLHKQYFNMGLRPPLYFWRDQNGRIEIDCLIDQGIKLSTVEIKSGQTIISNFFDNLTKWNEISESSAQDNYIIYAGEEVQSRTIAQVIGWKKAALLVEKLEKK